MSDISWFKFENKDLDFPFYNKNPYISKRGWLVLFISILIAYCFIAIDILILDILSVFVPLIALLYFLHWDYHPIFQKPKAKDIALAIGLFIGYMIYASIMSNILGLFGLTGAMSPDVAPLISILSLIFSVMTEEFIKLIPFLFLLTVFFKYSNNRKLSAIGSMLVVMIIFAALHSDDFITLIFAIFVQGFGSIFEFIGYFKTKNVFIPYLAHIITDVFITLLALL